MQQDFVQIGEVNVPMIIENGIKYYPISYITTKLLKRSNKNGLIHKGNKKDYDEYIKKFVVKFGESNVQEANCIEEKGLALVLGKTQQGRLDVNQKKSQNQLHEYLGLELLTTREQIINNMHDEYLKEHDLYTQDVIQLEIKKSKDIKFQSCNKCEKYHPLTSKFYMIDNRRTEGFTEICRVCSGKVESFIHDDAIVNYMKNKGVYEAYKEKDVIPVIKSFLNGDIRRIPKCFQNKKDYLKVVDYIIDNYDLNKYEISVSEIYDKYKIPNIYKYLTNHTLFTHLFGKSYYLFPWRYKNFSFKEIPLTYEIANKVFKNYLKEFNVDFTNPLEFDYEKHCKYAKLKNLTNGNVLYFAVQFNKFKYPGYMFKSRGNNYYDNKDNLLFDLKYLIEKDMKLKVEKIPLYLTKYVLQKKCKQLYHNVITKKNGSLYHWINKLYPNKFIEADFEVNPYRHEFDSDKEMYIHEILNEMYGNVIYNQKHTDRTVTIDGMIPDWLVFTNRGVWIVEYFGMYDPKNRHNSRIRDYIEKTHRKMERYKQVRGYNFIYLYPDDIEDDYLGCREKFKKIGLESMVTRV